MDQLDNILPEELSYIPSRKIDLNSEEFFNLRFFKYLTNYSDISLVNSDLFLRQNLMNIYLFHIINHILIRNEEIEVNNHLEKVLKAKQNKSINNILKEELIKNPDEDFLLDYIKTRELTNLLRNEYFKEFSYDINKLKKLLNLIKNENKEINSDNNSKESNQNIENLIFENIKDQGFTSPKALILVPYKKHARLLIDELINILKSGNWKGIKNKKKFREEYSENDAMNDCFRIGISFNYFENKVTLYESFENADLIIASPLGVKLTRNSEGDKQEKIYDFLSSIEILLVDFAEVFTFQNISHLEEVLSVINNQPRSNANIVDINRIKENYKDNNSEFFRQSIFVSHFKNLEIEMLMKNFCKNVFKGSYNFLEKYQNILFEKNAIEKDIENSKQDKIEEEIYEGLGLDRKRDLKNKKNKIKDVDNNNENDDENDFDKVEEIISDPKNNKIKFEFKILRCFDDLDILDNKFNFFTKNVSKFLLIFYLKFFVCIYLFDFLVLFLALA